MSTRSRSASTRRPARPWRSRGSPKTSRSRSRWSPLWNADGTALARGLLLCLLAPALGIAQADTAAAGRPDTARPFHPVVLPDTLASGMSPAATAARPSKSPWLAVGLSAVAPGAGQIYTENYWKAPVIWALGGYWIYEWTKQNDRYREFSDLYNQSVTPATPKGSDNLRNSRDFYRDERDKFAWFLGGL